METELKIAAEVKMPLIRAQESAIFPWGKAKHKLINALKHYQGNSHATHIVTDRYIYFGDCDILADIILLSV